MTTYHSEMHSGTFIDLLNPHASDIHLKDVAHHLSQICRFNGGTPEFYSVAEHSVLVKRYVERAGHGPLVQLHGLLHDAHEAYIGDIVTSVKRLLGERYYDLRDRLDLAICERFGLEWHHFGTKSSEVWEGDQALLAVEAYYFMASSGEVEPWNLPQIDELQRKANRPLRLAPGEAKALFIEEYNRLVPQLNKLKLEYFA